jgi:hypothetical protein
MRLKIFTLDSFMLNTLLSAGVKHFEVVGNPLPEDVTIAGIQPSLTHGETYLILQSASFPESVEGVRIPDYGPLTIRKIPEN